LFIAKHYPNKLSAALLGRGYFTAVNDIKSCGKLYQIFPDIVEKLYKHHPSQVAKQILYELLQELGRVSNHDNNFLIQS
jgi:hypothetical protein